MKWEAVALVVGTWVVLGALAYVTAKLLAKHHKLPDCSWNETPTAELKGIIIVALCAGILIGWFLFGGWTLVDQ